MAGSTNTSFVAAVLTLSPVLLPLFTRDSFLRFYLPVLIGWRQSMFEFPATNEKTARKILEHIKKSDTDSMCRQAK